eukprot:scaffold9104_cov100-Isochrysis_galbana.AAC.5
MHRTIHLRLQPLVRSNTPQKMPPQLLSVLLAGKAPTGKVLGRFFVFPLDTGSTFDENNTSGAD